MIQRNFLYLVLALTLISVPVFQAAHALTHINEVDTISLAQVDSNHDHDDADFDKFCLDCLALAAFSVIFSILAAFPVNLIMRQQLRHIKRKHILRNFFFTYLTRAPPLA